MSDDKIFTRICSIDERFLLNDILVTVREHYAED